MEEKQVSNKKPCPVCGILGWLWFSHNSGTYYFAHDPYSTGKGKGRNRIKHCRLWKLI